MVKILFLGDVVGEPGRMAACRTTELYLERGDADFVVVNGENAAAGRGITPKLAIDLMRSGVAVITSATISGIRKRSSPTSPRNHASCGR